MEKQKGITLISLTITIVVIMILAGITTYIGKDLIKETKLQDLKTNMLLIQAKAKEYVEEVSFQKANITDAAKIEEIKTQNLKGHKLIENEEIKSIAENLGKIDTTKIDEYYYLSEQDLVDMGIEKLSAKDYGYFIIRYNIQDIKVEVINTNGYNGNYTLEELNNL